MKTYIGIDPGKSGAIVVLDSGAHILEKIVTPTIGKEYDIQKMRDILMQYQDSSVTLENINGHVAQGRTTAFVMGQGLGIWKGLLMGIGMGHTLVTPQTWQKEMHHGVPVQYKAGKKKKKDTKKMSLIAVQRLFPNADLRKSDKATNPHDGICDAMLLAEYGRRARY